MGLGGLYTHKFVSAYALLSLLYPAIIVEGPSPLVFLKIGTFCWPFLGSSALHVVWVEGVELFLKIYLWLFYIILQTSWTNLNSMIQKIKNKKSLTVQIFYNLQNHPSFYAEARGRECFVGQSILLDNDSTMLSERSTRMGETSTTPWLSSRKVIIIIKKPILKIFKFKYK